MLKRGAWADQDADSNNLEPCTSAIKLTNYMGVWDDQDWNPGAFDLEPGIVATELSRYLREPHDSLH